jgi:hypothetical protein
MIVSQIKNYFFARELTILPLFGGKTMSIRWRGYILDIIEKDDGFTALEFKKGRDPREYSGTDVMCIEMVKDLAAQEEAIVASAWEMANGGADRCIEYETDELELRMQEYATKIIATCFIILPPPIMWIVEEHYTYA